MDPNINYGDFLLKIADFFGSLCDFIYKILFTQFNLFGLSMNMLTMLFVIGIPTWIVIIIIKAVT